MAPDILLNTKYNYFLFYQVLGLLSRHQEAGYWAVLYGNGYYYRSNTEGRQSMLRVAQ